MEQLDRRGSHWVAGVAGVSVPAGRDRDAVRLVAAAAGVSAALYLAIVALTDLGGPLDWFREPSRGDARIVAQLTLPSSPPLFGERDRPSARPLPSARAGTSRRDSPPFVSPASRTGAIPAAEGERPSSGRDPLASPTGSRPTASPTSPTASEPTASSSSPEKEDALIEPPLPLPEAEAPPLPAVPELPGVELPPDPTEPLDEAVSQLPLLEP